MNQKKENKISEILAKIRWILPVALWGVLTFCSYQFLLKVEERSLFVYDLFWLSDFFKKPSGILSCCGAFFTQFLHIPWMGAFLWVLLLTASAELTRIVFRIPNNLSLLSYIPVSIFVTYNMAMGYMVYSLNLPGYFFLPVLGYLWALLTVSVLRKIQKPSALLMLTVLWGFVGYYLAGFYAIIGIITAAIDIVLYSNCTNCRISVVSGALVAILFAPIVFVPTTTYNLSAGWTIGMPEQIFGLSRSRMQLPIVAAMLFLLAMPFLRHFLNKLSGKTPSGIIQGLALAAALVIPTVFWFRDDNFKAELQMINAVDNLEWDKAIDIYSRLQKKHEKESSWQPTRVLVLLKDLALIKTDKDGQLAFNFDDGSKVQKRDFNLPMSLQIGKTLFFYYGIPGLCNRWCIEESVLSGWNNMTYKYIAMNAILQGNTCLATKYLDKLEYTLFYRKWARQQLKLCENNSLVSTTSPYDKILPLMCYDDKVCSDFDGCELFLTNHFNGPSPLKSTPFYDRVALMFALKSKQSTLFWTRLFLYLDSNNPSKIDRYYQEAAYLFSINSHNEELFKSFPFDDNIKNIYNTFIDKASKVGKKNIEEARASFSPNLRHTFYFYYYYVNELQMF